MTTTFNPLNHGVYRRLCDQDGDIDTRVWNRAVEGGEFVGSCRACGGFLLGEPTHQAGQITWYGGRCVDCKAEFAAPNARKLRRSSRHDQMPAGWFALRTKKDAK